MHEDIAADPPDPNFATVQPPVFSTLTPSGSRPATPSPRRSTGRRRTASPHASRTSATRAPWRPTTPPPSSASSMPPASSPSPSPTPSARRPMPCAPPRRRRSRRSKASRCTPPRLSPSCAMAQRVTTDGFTAAETAQLEALGATAEDIVNGRTWSIGPSTSRPVLRSTRCWSRSPTASTPASGRPTPSPATSRPSSSRSPSIARRSCQRRSDGRRGQLDDDRRPRQRRRPDGDTLTASVPPVRRTDGRQRPSRCGLQPPAPNFSGSAHSACPRQQRPSRAATATVSSPSNRRPDPPRASDDNANVADQQARWSSASHQQLADPDSDALTITARRRRRHRRLRLPLVVCDCASPTAPSDNWFGCPSAAPGRSATATVAISVPSDHPPDATGDAVTLGVGATANLSVLDNDADTDGGRLTIVWWTESGGRGARWTARRGAGTGHPPGACRRLVHLHSARPRRSRTDAATSS